MGKCGMSGLHASASYYYGGDGDVPQGIEDRIVARKYR